MRGEEESSSRGRGRGEETPALHGMCVERGRKLRDPFKFNVTTKLENV